MINGMAFGGRCEVGVTCDIRIAAESARLGMPPAKLGLIYLPAGLMRFVNIVGMANAKEIFFTGRYFPVARAKEMGLVNYAVPDAQLVSFTEEMAQEISGTPPCPEGDEDHLQHANQIPEDRSRRHEGRRIAGGQSFNSEDLKEGQKAFLEKEETRFQGEVRNFTAEKKLEDWNDGKWNTGKAFSFPTIPSFHYSILTFLFNPLGNYL